MLLLPFLHLKQIDQFKGDKSQNGGTEHWKLAKNNSNIKDQKAPSSDSIFNSLTIEARTKQW
jgi:hypothetical protein